MANITTDQINQARTILESAKAIVIALPQSPTLDSVASALSLYLALSGSGKQVNVVCPTQMTVEFNHLVGVDKVGTAINGSSGKNLVIAFPYQEGSIEKVSYNIENDTFNLVIEPRENYPVITPEMINYSYSGGNIDLIITISTPRLTDLGTLYNNSQSLFNQKPVINIDYRSQNIMYGKVNIVDPTVSSSSELTTSLLSQLGFSIDADIATNLYVGIASGSQNFTSPATSAFTFETAAICLRNGAKKIAEATSPLPSFPQAQSQVQRPAASPAPFPKTPRPFFPKGQKPKMVPNFQQPQSQSQPQQLPAKEPTQAETPPDWLKPKIYKGSTLL